MSIILHYNFPFFLSETTNASFNVDLKTEISLHSRSFLTKHFLRSSSNLSLVHQSSALWNQYPTKNLVICARNSKRRIGYGSIKRILLQSIYFVALKFNILPEPLALAIREFGGGNNGGGVGFLKGFGGGGFDRWKKKKQLWFLGFLLISGLLIWLGLGKEIEGDVFLAILTLILLGASVKLWKRGLKDCILGVCFSAALGVVWLRGVNFPRRVKAFGAMKNLSRRKRRRAT